MRVPADCSAFAATDAVYLAETLGARLYDFDSVEVLCAFHVGIHVGEAVAELNKWSAAQGSRTRI